MKQHNFLLVGLGGTGCAVARELKKRLYVEWHSQGNSGSYPEVYTFQDKLGKERIESRIATLSVDSNASDLEGEGERSREWRVFGEELRLGDREKVLIDPSSINRILDSIERYPSISPWVRDELSFVRDLARGSTEPAGCNQIRRMGRLALANGNNIQNVINAVANRLDQLSSGGQVGADIHIACTLAAGTGSGTLIDVITQIQRYLKSQPGKHQVYVHGFVTAKDVGSVNTGNFYANQYAALSELNAFRLGIYHPWDILATQKAARLSVPSPSKETGDLAGTFRSIALITETTEGNTDVPLNHQIENVAEFIFQLSVRQMGDVPKQLRDALSLEDRTSYPTDVNGGNRATSFISYGVQRAAIPEKEIREKLVYTFGRQFALKVLYNNWDRHFRDNPRNFTKDGFVGDRRGIWQTTREHLCLDIVEDSTGQPEFRTYEVDWQQELGKQVDRVKEVGDDYHTRKGWITDFNRRADLFWEKGFRTRGHSGGSVDYFKVRREPTEIRIRARNIRATIERDLLQGIERGDPEYILHHLPDAVGFLLKNIENERLYFGKLAAEAVENMKSSNRQRSNILSEFNKGGWFAKGKHERLFNKYRDATVSFYYWSTMQLAAEYAQMFCIDLIEELKYLLQQINLFNTRMKQIAAMFKTEIEVRINGSETANEREDIDYLVDTDYTNETIRQRFKCDQSIQENHVNVTMKALTQLRGDCFEFSAYNEKMPSDDRDRVGGALIDELERVSEKNAIEAHRKIRKDDTKFEGIFNQNLVRKLYKDYGGRVDGDLEEWLRSLMDKSMPMLSFDPNEEPMDLPTQGPVLRRFVFVPHCKEVPDDFEKQLEEKIKSIIGGRGSCKDVKTHFKSVPNDRNPSEIVIITMAFFFPARHTRVVHGLKEHYQKRLEQNSDQESRRAYFNVHTETHRPRLPDLMKLGRKQVLEEQFAPVLLANAIGLMQIPEENGEQILFGHVDNFGRVKDKVESGMKMNTEVRVAATESKERFGQEIPVEMIALYLLYREQFLENNLDDISNLLKPQLSEMKDIMPVKEHLNMMSGQAFLLSGKKEADETYQLFDSKVKEAWELAKCLADRSSL